MDLFKSNIKKGVGEGNFGYGKYKKDGSGLGFTYQTKKKLQKEKEDFMKGKNKFGPEPTNYSNMLANVIEKATAKLDKINDKMAYKLDMVRPSKSSESYDSFNLTGFKDKGEYKERKVKDVTYAIKKYNNSDKVDELIQLYQSRKKYLSIANKTMKTNTKFSSFDKLVKMIFDDYVEIYYYSTTQKKYCKVVVDPDTDNIISMKITNNKTVNFSLSNDTNLNSQLNNLFSLLEQVERSSDISKSNVLKLKVSLDNFFNTHSTDTQVEEVQNGLRDDYNTFVEENFEHKIDNDIIFIYSKFKNIINKIQNSLENKRTNFSLINKNFNNMRNFNMSRKEMIDFAQRMKEIRMSHNFSNDITKQHELFDVINELFTFSEGKISGTEYKIKQLVSKLPSDKKAKGTEKLNSLVDSLKKKGLKEKEIISRLDAKADKIDRLVAFSKKSKGESAIQKFDKLDKWTKIPLAVGGTILGANAINAVASPFAAKYLAEGFNGMTNAITQTTPQQQPQSFLGSIFGKDGKEVEEENFSKKSKKASETLKKAALLGTAGAGATVLANPYINKAKEYVNDVKEDLETGKLLREDARVKDGGMSTKDLVKGLQGSEKELATTRSDLEKANETINTNKSEYEKTLAATQDKHAKDLANLEETYKDSAALKKAAEEAVQRAEASEKAAAEHLESVNQYQQKLNNTQGELDKAMRYIQKDWFVGDKDKAKTLIDHYDNQLKNNEVTKQIGDSIKVATDGKGDKVVDAAVNTINFFRGIGGDVQRGAIRTNSPDSNLPSPGVSNGTSSLTNGPVNHVTKTPENATNDGQSSSAGSSFEFKHINPSVPTGFPMLNNNLGVNMPMPKVETPAASDTDSKVEEDVVEFFYSNKWKLF